MVTLPKNPTLSKKKIHEDDDCKLHSFTFQKGNLLCQSAYSFTKQRLKHSNKLITLELSTAK